MKSLRSLPLLKPHKWLHAGKPIFVRRVSGVSMEPYVGPGAVVVARSVFVKLKKYDVVVVRQHGIEKIKRVLHVRNGKIFLVGDNPNKSTDSRHFGWIP